MANLLQLVVKRARALKRDQVVVMLAVLSVVSYAFQYLIYVQFYSSFGLRPRDVGLDRLRLAEESVIGLITSPYAIARVYAWLIAVVVVVAVVLWSIFLLRTGRPLRWPELASTAVVAALACLLVVVAYTYGDLLQDARRLGNEVRSDGRIIVSWMYEVDDYRLPSLDIVAIPADVRRSDSATEPVTPGCTLFLGQSLDQAILHDVRRDAVVRVPVDGLDLTTHPALRHYDDERLPEGCTSDEGNRVSARNP